MTLSEVELAQIKIETSQVKICDCLASSWDLRKVEIQVAVINSRYIVVT